MGGWALLTWSLAGLSLPAGRRPISSHAPVPPCLVSPAIVEYPPERKALCLGSGDPYLQMSSAGGATRNSSWLTATYASLASLLPEAMSAGADVRSLGGATAFSKGG